MLSLSRLFSTVTSGIAVIGDNFAIQGGAVHSVKLINEANPKFNSVELELGN